MNRFRKRPQGLLCVSVIVLAAGGAVWSQVDRLPKRFAAVVPDALYRSGAVSPAQLQKLAQEHGIERVVCLLNADAEETRAERDAAQRLQIEWHNVPLPGNGASTPEERKQIIGLLLAPDAGPTLVHCAAGATRTGLAVGLYRLYHDGWSVEQVLAEMRHFGFEAGPQHECMMSALREEAAEAKSLP